MVQDTTLRLTLARNVRLLREHAGRSQRDYAARSGLEQPYLSQVENGVWNLRLDSLSRLAEALDVTPRDLLDPFFKVAPNRPPPSVPAPAEEAATPSTTGLRTLVGANVKLARELAGWGQRELAARTGLMQAYVSQLENGQWNVGIDNVARIAHALAVPPFELFDTGFSQRAHAFFART